MSNVLEVSTNQILEACKEVAMGKYKVIKISETAFKCEPVGIGYVWENMLVELLHDDTFVFKFQTPRGVKSLTQKWTFVDTTDLGLAATLDSLGTVAVSIFAKRGLAHKHAMLLPHILN